MIENYHLWYFSFFNDYMYCNLLENVKSVRVQRKSRMKFGLKISKIANDWTTYILTHFINFEFYFYL